MNGLGIQALDHGYCELIDSWGSDEHVIEAARMSTGKGFLGWGPVSCQRCDGDGKAHGSDRPSEWSGPWTYPGPCPVCRGSGTVPGDEKLLRYLWENKHSTPFEMAGMTIEVQAPIFVFREWRTHRTCSQLDDVDSMPWEMSFNEMSARYTTLPNLNYVPSIERLMMGSDSKNKQAGTIKGAAVLTSEAAEEFRNSLANMYQDQQTLYEEALAVGVPKELARIHLPVGRYSRMRASANLRNWLAFLTLRTAPQAQWEIRMYANEVGKLIAERFPRTWELFQGVSDAKDQKTSK